MNPRESPLGCSLGMLAGSFVVITLAAGLVMLPAFGALVREVASWIPLRLGVMARLTADDLVSLEVSPPSEHEFNLPSAGRYAIFSTSPAILNSEFSLCQRDTNLPLFVEPIEDWYAPGSQGIIPGVPVYSFTIDEGGCYRMDVEGRFSAGRYRVTIAPDHSVYNRTVTRWAAAIEGLILFGLVGGTVWWYNRRKARRREEGG